MPSENKASGASHATFTNKHVCHDGLQNYLLSVSNYGGDSDYTIL
jgi:hypothetical protein